MPNKEKSDYKFCMYGNPDFGYVEVMLNQGQHLKVEAAAMATMDTNLKIKTQFRGGLGRFLTGESIFLSDFWSDKGTGILGIAPGSPGSLEHVYLENETIFLQNSSFVACSPSLNIETKWQGLVKGFFSRESLFLIRVSGTGDLWFNTYGAFVEIDVNGEYIVDTGCIAGFTAGLDYDIKMVGGYKSTFFSGEGLVCRFKGVGKIWLQSRQVPQLASALWPFRPQKSSND